MLWVYFPRSFNSNPATGGEQGPDFLLFVSQCWIHCDVRGWVDVSIKSLIVHTAGNGELGGTAKQGLLKAVLAGVMSV